MLGASVRTWTSGGYGARRASGWGIMTSLCATAGSAPGGRILATVERVPHRDVGAGRATAFDLLHLLGCGRTLVPAAECGPRHAAPERAYPRVADQQPSEAEQDREDQPATGRGRGAVGAGTHQRQARDREQPTDHDAGEPAGGQQRARAGQPD